MMKNFSNWWVIGFLFISSSLMAQTRSISGTVKDGTGMGVPGVTLKVKGTTKGTATGGSGEFKIDGVSSSNKLQISAIGYEAQEIAVPAEGDLAIVLKDASQVLDAVVIAVGSRNSKRTATDTPLPVDIISATELRATGQPSFDKALQYSVPSFNTVNTPVNDATSLLDPYEIRNMGPSRTLILINGKRKNSSALTYIQTSPGRGESGADISAIPTAAIKRVEILRDGASAQYGSDAIAGVMNVILKDNFDYGSVTLKGGATSKGDGVMEGISINNGANFGEKGYLNYTIDLSHTSLANRPGIVDAKAEANSDIGLTDAAHLGDVQAFLAKYPDAKNINGSPENTAAKFLINGGVTLSSNTEFYYNAAYVYKKVNSFANYRTPYWKPLADNPSLIFLVPSGNPADYTGYAPTFQGDLNDYNATLGVRSEKNGWKTDASFTTGGNKQLYTVSNTVNFGLGLNTPIYFKPGGYNFNNNVFNIDVTKSLADNLSLGLGSEFRVENYEIIAGDSSSYVKGGANSFPGIGANNAGNFSRYNFGGYVDLGWDVTKDFLLNGTIREEQYSDFGNAFVWKLSTRYKFLDDKVTLRGSISTGFRAPSLQQINLQIAQASFVPGQGIQTKGIVNNNSAQARVLGVPQLKPEKSVNFTVGLGVSPTKNFSFTLDYYNIKVTDRIILSSEIGHTTAGNTNLDKVLTNNGIVAVSFFTNGIDTRTQGLDLVVNYKGIALGNGKLNMNIAGNYTFQNAIIGGLANGVHNPSLIANAGKSILDATQEALLLSSRPKYKVILGANYTLGKLGISLNNTLFGKTTFHQNGIDDNLNTEFIPKIVTDLGASIEIAKNTRFSVNVQNLFNILPSWKFVSLNTKGENILKDANQVWLNTNLITFDGRYSTVTYDGSHFSQLGTTFVGQLTFTF